ncbi:hypothetical protein CANCADRAFT_17420, partial [Tortispora caseinolytica NRRL Y-17796]
ISTMSPDAANAKLTELQQSYYVSMANGVSRYDIVQLPSNSPIEDDHSEKVVRVKLGNADPDSALATSTDWMFWGVYDGHGGWTTSAKLRDLLIDYVVRELDLAYTVDKTTRAMPSPEVIDAAIANGFVNLDKELVYSSISKFLGQADKKEAARFLAPALSGSCGLLAFYDSQSCMLRVAVTGDSRAVLGTRNPSNGTWKAIVLSEDQTGSNPSEVKRLQAEHPGEENTVIRHGRVLGSLEPTRAFGDARYKWTYEVQQQIAQAFFGRRSPPALKSPPYVTAKPVVTSYKVSPENGDFLVMGSDGLFEMLSNEEVVSLVAQWISQNPDKVGKSAAAAHDAQGSSFFSQVWNKVSGSGPSGPPKPEDVEVVQNHPGKPPIRKEGKSSSGAKYIVTDENAATHLVRNALGGSDIEQVAMMLSIPSPLSRSYRDDLTVTVVFFGNSEAKNSIDINDEATSARFKVAA